MTAKLDERFADILTPRNQIPTKAEFEALAERVRRAMAGSGFVEWGGYEQDENSYPDRFVNHGLWCQVSPYIENNPDLFSDTIFYGTPVENRSNSVFPVVNVNGYLLKLIAVRTHKVNGSGTSFSIKFPSSPSSPDQLYRQDLVFLECWHEIVDEKDVVFPYGNVQYGADSYTAPDGTSFSTTPITDLGIAQGYSAFGAWDTETIGEGIRWSSLTDEQKSLLLVILGIIFMLIVIR